MENLETILGLITNPEEVRKYKKKPLLIIDDNIEMIEAMKVILNKDYELIVCNSYEEIQSKMSDQIHVVLLDIKMAYKDGIEIFSLLKARYPSLKIIFHSAYPGNATQALLIESLPHAGYLTKGEYDIQDLFFMLEKAFTRV